MDTKLELELVPEQIPMNDGLAVPLRVGVFMGFGALFIHMGISYGYKKLTIKKFLSESATWSIMYGWTACVAGYLWAMLWNVAPFPASVIMAGLNLFVIGAGIGKFNRVCDKCTNTE